MIELKIVADNIRITNPVIEKAVREFNPDPIMEMALRCEAAGADCIDINTGPLGKEPERQMTFWVETVEAVTDLPLLIDTANPIAMDAGLRAAKKRPIINGFSLEPQKLDAILPLAHKYNTEIIGYLLYSNGHVPLNESDRLEVAASLLAHLEKNNIDKYRLIIDPVVPPVNWQDGHIQAQMILSVIRMLPEMVGFEVRTIAALSNLTAGKADIHKKKRLQAAYLPMLVASGLDMAMVDVFNAELVALAKASDALCSSHIFSWETI